MFSVGDQVEVALWDGCPCRQAHGIAISSFKWDKAKESTGTIIGRQDPNKVQVGGTPWFTIRFATGRIADVYEIFLKTAPSVLTYAKLSKAILSINPLEIKVVKEYADSCDCGAWKTYGAAKGSFLHTPAGRGLSGCSWRDRSKDELQ